MILIIISAIIAYFLGAIPTAVWYGKKIHKIDVRNYGSGNAGATNTFRVLGKKAGAIVMLIDSLKGSIATLIPIFINNNIIKSEYITIYQICLGIIAVIGHIYPIFAKFKGGKGVATILGITIALHPLAALTCIVVFIIILITTKYVSLASIISGLTFPILMYLPLYNNNEILKGYGYSVFILLIFTHKQNIIRLYNGNENKTYLTRKI